MNATLSYDVNIDLIFTDEEFALLDTAIDGDSQLRHHAEIGNFWYGIAISRPFYTEDPQICTFTRRQVDTVLIKSIEMLAQYPNPAQEAYRKLYTELMAILSEAIAEAAELNGLASRR